ncbi:MAG: hypothetical protein M1829_004416 [Trizodia sp. TS-e1964]|nr:MAG: hypothetical protein M1829_004416 [Trizodia sp. TS-e1964]
MITIAVTHKSRGRMRLLLEATVISKGLPPPALYRGLFVGSAVGLRAEEEVIEARVGATGLDAVSVVSPGVGLLWLVDLKVLKVDGWEEVDNEKVEAVMEAEEEEADGEEVDDEEEPDGELDVLVVEVVLDMLDVLDVVDEEVEVEVGDEDEDGIEVEVDGFEESELGAAVILLQTAVKIFPLNTSAKSVPEGAVSAKQAALTSPATLASPATHDFEHDWSKSDTTQDGISEL